MLPPQLRSSLLTSSHRAFTSLALKASVPHVLHARAFWSWRRDWTSHLDPAYHRFNRIRTLKTRAKLFKNLRRRGKFDWDIESRPFFTPRLVRYASHWDGSGRRKEWLSEAEAAKKAKDANGTGKSVVEEAGFELSAREKEWKDKMEAWRKRIEKNPYEAVFGKRFEPFWSPLVPSWMREEMGLQGWPRTSKDAIKDAKSTTPEVATTKTVKNETASKAKPTKPELSKDGASTAKTSALEPKHAAGAKPASYSYASSTSWDSWSNKARKVEWDSVSGRTRKYEYDPISNWMIQIDAPTSPSVEMKSIPAKQSAASSGVTASPDHSISTNVPSAKAAVKPLSELRKAIPVPQSTPSSSLGLGGMNVTSVGPLRPTAIAPDTPRVIALSSDSSKPSALARLSEKQPQIEKDVELLTADQVRAAMGKTRSSPKAVEQSEERSEIEAILRERDTARDRMHVSQALGSQWDQAEMGVMLDKELENLQKKKQKLLKDERGLFHIERQKQELQKLDERINQVTERVEKLNLAIGPAVKTSMVNVTKPAGLQTSLERMQSKELPIAVDLDDSAAHESTGGLAAPNGVPKNWGQQAELLQADRVRRTASQRPYPMAVPVTRWEDDMNARKAAYEAERAKQVHESETSQADAKKRFMLEKANKLLEAEVADQKMKMQAHETRYAHKIRSLRQELEIAYKQSTVHAEEHLERIHNLEQELQKALNSTKSSAAVVNATQPDQADTRIVEIEKKYAQKIRSLREELEVAYKQSTVHSEKHLERVRELESQLEKVQKAAGPTMSTLPPPRSSDDMIQRREMEKAQQKSRDQALVRELRKIYEDAYGAIDTSHRQPQSEKMTKQAAFKNGKQIVEVESDVDLGEALARYEKDAAPYSLPQIALENEIATKERSFYEGPGEGSSIQPKANFSKKLVHDTVPKSRSIEVSKTSAGKEAAEAKTEPESSASTSTVQWEHPPVYKVLAYDSGNDMMSTATTTSNFTGKETPISISQALSELYQPARFVPYFADLQKDGYQVIFGTKDLLLFKKVKGVSAIVPQLQDHGLFAEKSTTDPVAGGLEAVHTRPSTGNFASPTGFVNHDPVLPIEKDAAVVASEPGSEDPNTEWRHYPRVRRMEQHFTGSRQRWNSNTRQRGYNRRYEDRETRRRHKRHTVRWVLGVGLGTATVMYLVGAATERSREAKEMDWARKAEEERKRWRAL